MSLASKIVALLGALTDADVESLPLAARRRFGAACRHAAAVAERGEQDKTPRAGVLASLRDGQRGE